MSGAYTKQEQTLPLSLSHILVKQHKTQVGSVAETSLLHRLSSMPYAFKQNGGRGRGWDKSFISVFACFLSLSISFSSSCLVCWLLFCTSLYSLISLSVFFIFLFFSVRLVTLLYFVIFAYSFFFLVFLFLFVMLVTFLYSVIGYFLAFLLHFPLPVYDASNFFVLCYSSILCLSFSFYSSCL